MGQYHIHDSPISGTWIWIALGLSALGLSALGLSALGFPKLALGMSGFETGVLHIHLVKGTSTSHTIAAIAKELSRKCYCRTEVLFGWSDGIPLELAIGFVLFGAGNVPTIVRELLRDTEHNRPRIAVAE